MRHATGTIPRSDGTAQHRARNRSLGRDGVLAALLVVMLWSVWAVREEPDPNRPSAVELTGRLDELYRDVRAGELVLGTTAREVAPEVLGARFPRTTREDRWVLVGASGSSCYVLWWDVDGDRRTRTLPSGEPCEPTRDAMSPLPGTYDRIGLQVVKDPAASSTWEGVVPDPIRLRWWYLPATILGSGLLLGALVRISVALLTGAPPSATRR